VVRRRVRRREKVGSVNTKVPLATEERVQRYIAERLPAWIDLLQRLIRVRSVFEAEEPIVQLVADHVAALGATPHRIAHDPARLGRLSGAQRPVSLVQGRSSLAVRIAGAGSGRSLILNAHLDVVPEGDQAAWRYPPFAAYIDRVESAIYGRGAMDDKAGVALALALMECLLKLPMVLEGDVVFHFVLEDETTGNGTLLCLDAGYVGDGALILDGTRSDRAIAEHAGNLQFEVHLKGTPASVSVSHLGVNAAEELARFLLQLRERIFALNEGRRPPWTRFPSPYQLTVQRLHSDGAQLTVPESAWAQCYMTFPPPDSLAAMRQRVEEIAERFAENRGLPQAPVLVWTGFATEPVRSMDSPLPTVLRDCAAALGMPPVDVGPSTGTSDMRHFVAWGIPCLLYGPGAGFNPHRPDEHYRLADFPRMLACCLEVAARWCGLADC